MSVECERVGGVNLSQGVCDLAVPQPVVDAAKAAIDQGGEQLLKTRWHAPAPRCTRRQVSAPLWARCRCRNQYRRECGCDGGTLLLLPCFAGAG